MLRHAALVKRHKRPVQTFVVLQRPEADNAKRFTGLHVQFNVFKRWQLKFRYRVVRMWKQRLDPLLRGPLEMLPFSVLTDEARSRWDEVVRHIIWRLSRAPRDESNLLAMTTYLLMGLRHDVVTAEAFRARMAAMKDSVTYQLVVEEGCDKIRAVMAQSILRIGCAKLGEPTASARARIEGMKAEDQLAALTERLALGDFASWEDLLK